MILRVEGSDHHLSLTLILHNEVACFEYKVHRVDHLMKAAGSSTLLREPNKAERVTLAMFNDCHNLNSE